MTLSEYVVASLILVLLFTVVITILKVATGLDFSMEYQTFCGVFGGEILTCCVIKVFKLRR